MPEKTPSVRPLRTRCTVVWLVLGLLLASSAPACAVVPGLAAPLQALGQLLLQLLPLAGAVVLSMFRGQAWRDGLRRCSRWLRTSAGVVCTLAALAVATAPVLSAQRGRRTVLAAAAVDRANGAAAPGGTAVAGGAARQPSAAGWPIFRGNLFRTGATGGESGPSKGRVVWTFSDPDVSVADISSSPAATGDRVYVGSAQASIFDSGGMVYCLQADTGKRLWQFQTDKQVFCSPAVADGRVYVGEGLHVDTACKLYCLDAATGRKMWTVTTRSHTESSPAIAGGRVYFGAGEDGAYCVDAKSGAVLWHFKGRHIDGSPAVADGKVYVGTGYGLLAAIALDAATGEPVWSAPSDLPVWGAPAVAGGRVYYGIGNGDFVKSSDHPRGGVWCLDAKTGRPIWRRSVPDAVLTAAVVHDDRIAVGSRDGNVYCLDAGSGKVRWSAGCGGPVVSSPAADHQTLFVAGSTGELQALDLATGRPAWRLDLKRETGPDVRIFSSPALSRGRLYLGSSKSKLFCIGG